MAKFYLVLTLLGTLLPYGALVPWVMTHGIDLPLLLSEAMANPISTVAWLDVLVSAVTLMGFILIDGHRQQIKYRSLALIGTFTVGVSCGLPLYLYLKEKQRRSQQIPSYSFNN